MDGQLSPLDCVFPMASQRQTTIPSSVLCWSLLSSCAAYSFAFLFISPEFLSESQARPTVGAQPWSPDPGAAQLCFPWAASCPTNTLTYCVQTMTRQHGPPPSSHPLFPQCLQLHQRKPHCALVRPHDPLPDPSMPPTVKPYFPAPAYILLAAMTLHMYTRVCLRQCVLTICLCSNLPRVPSHRKNSGEPTV